MKKMMIILLTIVLLVGCDSPSNSQIENSLSDSQIVEKYLMWKDKTFKTEEEERNAKPTKEEFKRLKHLDLNEDGRISPVDYVKLVKMGR